MSLDAVYWLKFVFGIVYGFFAAWLVAVFRQPAITYLLIIVSALAYVIVAEILWRVLDRDKRRRQSYFNGLGGFIGIFLLMWILFFNFLVGQ